ncbi:hypothetical protein DM01DRAFT_260735 [Hesseltinella vesiculosa]|uniref:Uncharacterized protein n=1 Tax=Hesseltinella vesiculosa TaxID=101127 RepID=A0A1X2GUY8_9FUNG|nr:hypothetical protein DM01DRAFT_260735 [Hesseltinella vesiculosa]
MAPKGHFFTQIPQPIHNSSEMKAIFDVGSTSIQNLPEKKIKHGWMAIFFMAYHSCLHFLGLHLSELTMAIRVNLSLMVIRQRKRGSGDDNIS